MEKETISLAPLHIPAGYREWVLQFHSKMDTGKLDPNGKALHVPLPEVFIPIETANPFYKPKEGRLTDLQGYKMDNAILDMARTKLLAIIESEASVSASLEERFEAGEILGQLGDPRIDVWIWPVTCESGVLIGMEKSIIRKVRVRTRRDHRRLAPGAARRQLVQRRLVLPGGFPRPLPPRLPRRQCRLSPLRSL